MSQAARATSVVVLPRPAGAMHSDGTRRRGRGRALVRREACEAVGDGRVEGHAHGAGRGRQLTATHRTHPAGAVSRTHR